MRKNKVKLAVLVLAIAIVICANAAKVLYQELTGKEVPNPDGHYTLVANLNEERKNL